MCCLIIIYVFICPFGVCAVREMLVLKDANFINQWIITLSTKTIIFYCTAWVHTSLEEEESRVWMKWLPFSSPVAHVYESLIHAGGSDTETESIILRLKWTWNYCHTIWPRPLENQSGVGNGWIHCLGSFILLYSWTLAVPGSFHVPFKTFLLSICYFLFSSFHIILSSDTLDI